MIDWSFLLKVLQARGFGVRWSGWILSLLSTGFFRVLINDQPRASFRWKRELRRRDTLSLVLFILGVDVLSRILKLAYEGGLFKKFVLGTWRFHVYSMLMTLLCTTSRSCLNQKGKDTYIYIFLNCYRGFPLTFINHLYTNFNPQAWICLRSLSYYIAEWKVFLLHTLASHLSRPPYLKTIGSPSLIE